MEEEIHDIMAPTLLCILEPALIAEGYDGLVAHDDECGCLIGDLSPSCCLSKLCYPGYKHTHSVSGEWIISTIREGLTDDQISDTIENRIYLS